MEQDAEMLGQGDTDVSQNPYQDLTEAALADYIARHKRELASLENDAFKKAAQQITTRDDAFLRSACDVRNGLFTIQRRIGQISEVLQDRLDAAGETKNNLVNEWKQMRVTCSRISKKSVCPLGQISHTIDDYRHAFPNEKSTFLKKLGQVSVVASIVAVISGYFFGDSLKAKALVRVVASL